MGMICTICSDSRRLNIDRALLSGAGKSSIAAQFGVGLHALRNHAEHHLSRQLMQSHKAKELVNSERLLDDIETMRARVIGILDRAERTGHLVTELKAIAEWRATLQFLTGLAIDLRRLDNEEHHTQQRQQVDELKNLSRHELELLQWLVHKSQGAEAEDRFNKYEMDLLHHVFSKGDNEELASVRIVPRQRHPDEQHEPEHQPDYEDAAPLDDWLPPPDPQPTRKLRRRRINHPLPPLR